MERAIMPEMDATPRITLTSADRTAIKQKRRAISTMIEAASYRLY